MDHTPKLTITERETTMKKQWQQWIQVSLESPLSPTTNTMEPLSRPFPCTCISLCYFTCPTPTNTPYYPLNPYPDATTIV